jgi:hypothetical protein
VEFSCVLVQFASEVSNDRAPNRTASGASTLSAAAGDDDRHREHFATTSRAISTCFSCAERSFDVDFS